MVERCCNRYVGCMEEVDESGGIVEEYNNYTVIISATFCLYLKDECPVNALR